MCFGISRDDYQFVIPQKQAASHADNFTFALVIPGMLRPSSKGIHFKEIHLIYLI